MKRARLNLPRGKSMFPPKTVQSVRKMWGEGFTQQFIGFYHDMSTTTAHKIISGKHPYDH